VSTVSANEVDNLAPFSFYTYLAWDPPILQFKPTTARTASGSPT